ncbi:hypothetical protein Tco_0058303 [Tanacetum coccineum]
MSPIEYPSYLADAIIVVTFISNDFPYLPQSESNHKWNLHDKGSADSGCSRHMTRNMSYLTDYKEIDGGYVTFGENPKGGKITRKGTKACDDAGDEKNNVTEEQRKEDVDPIKE